MNELLVMNFCSDRYKENKSISETYLSIKLIFLIILIFSFFSFDSLAEASESKDNPKLNIQDLALPSDTEGIRKEGSSIYFAIPSKGKILIPVHIWGEVNKAGLHYLPSETDVVKALSLAGGPRTAAKLENVKLTRVENNVAKEYKFDLSEGGGTVAYQSKLNPGDTIFVEKNYFYENRIYYTSLAGVLATLVTAYVLYNRMEKGYR